MCVDIRRGSIIITAGMDQLIDRLERQLLYRRKDNHVFTANELLNERVPGVTNTISCAL